MGCIMAIDSGLTGGIAVLNQEGEIEYCAPPALIEYSLKSGKKKRKLDVLMFKALLNTYRPEAVAIELINDRPGQGGMFAFGRMYGEYTAIILTQGYALTEISPQEWKKSMVGLFPKGTKQADIKKESIKKAYELKPNASFKDPDFVPSSRKKVGNDLDGLAEAFLIAEHFRRKHFAQK